MKLTLLSVLATACLSMIASAQAPHEPSDVLQEQVVALQREKSALQRENRALMSRFTSAVRSKGVCYWREADCLQQRDLLNTYFGMASTPELSISADCQIEQQALGSVCEGRNYILRSYVKLTPEPKAAAAPARR